MERIGTAYGGWELPKNINLNESSIVYSGGVGEDISFDLKLNDKYKSNIVLIDPTERALKHFKEIQEFYKNKDFKFTGDIQEDYLTHIFNLKPNFDKFIYINKGLHNEKGILRFYKQTNPNYVSQSLVENMFGQEYDEVEVDSIKNIMQQYNHQSIDLLKLDIEGSEISVLEQMLNDNIFPRYLCVEFDLLLKNKDPENLTQKLVDRLQSYNYRALVNNDLNITFERV